MICLVLYFDSIQVKRDYLPHTLNISQILPVVFPLAGPSVFDVNLASFPWSSFNQGEHCLCYLYLSQKSENRTQISGATQVLQASSPDVYELLSALTSEVLVLGASIILALLVLIHCKHGCRPLLRDTHMSTEAPVSRLNSFISINEQCSHHLCREPVLTRLK